MTRRHGPRSPRRRGCLCRRGGHPGRRVPGRCDGYRRRTRGRGLRRDLGRSWCRSLCRRGRRRRGGHRRGQLQPLGDGTGDGLRQPVLALAQRGLRGRVAQLDDLAQGRAVGRVAAEAAGHHRPQLLGQGAEVGVLVHDPVEHRVRGPVAEDGGPDRGVGRDLPEGEDVGGRGDRAGRGLFGRHERRGADADAGTGQGGGVGGPGDAEVDDARAVGGEQHIGGLQVPVDDARAVDDVQRLGDPDGQQQHAAHRQRAVPGHGVGERGAGYVGRGQPGPGALGVGVDDRCGVEPLDPLRGPHLLLEAPPELGVLAELGPDHLDGDGPAARRVGEIDLAHAARAQHGRQAVAAHDGRVVRLERLEEVGGRCAAHGIHL